MTSTLTAINQTQSLAAIRNFVRAAVSFITYARGLCSENAYEQRSFIGIPLRQLIPSTTESITISEWIETGAFDALNKNYLREMSLCVYDEDCKTLLESYCFGFNYSADGQRAQMSLAATQHSSASGGGEKDSQHGSIIAGSLHGNTADAAATAAVPTLRKRRCTKEDVQRMLLDIFERLLDVVGCLPPLLSKRVLTMRLTYYDNVTPATYEPPCFAPASRQMQQLYQEEVKMHVHIGSMDTSHHLFSVAIRHPLLQQIQSQITDANSVKGAVGGGGSARMRGEGDGDAERSALLRSRLESTFCSSDAVVTANAEQKQKGIEMRPNAGGERSPACPVDPSACRAPASGAADSETNDAGAVSDSEASAASVGAAVEEPLGSVSDLVDAATAVNGRRPLRQRETTYLLLACFVFAHAPSVRGGRGCVSARDVEAYRAESCPVDVAAARVQQMLQQLVREGHLCPCGQNTLAKAKREAPAAAAAAPGKDEWTVPDPPLPLLQRLLQLQSLTQLLSHPCHVALQELCVFLERERSRAGATYVAHDETAVKARRKRGRA